MKQLKVGDKVSWEYAYNRGREVVKLKKRITGEIVSINEYKNALVKRDGNSHRFIVPIKYLDVILGG